MLRQANIAAGRGRRAQVGAGFDAVRHDRVRRAVQACHALDADHVGAGAGDVRAHGDEAIGQIDHFRLARGVLDDRFAVGQAGRHHQVLGAGHGDHVGDDARALQATAPWRDVAVLDWISAPIACRPLMC